MTEPDPSFASHRSDVLGEIVIYTGSNQDLLARLYSCAARYMVIGSTAAWYRVPGWPEPNDLDIVIDPTEETARKVAEAVNKIEGMVVVADAKLLARPNTGFPSKRTLNVDVLTPILGFDFAEHWGLAEDVSMAYTTHTGTVVRVASIATLIAWKRLAMPREPTRADKIGCEIERLEEAARNPPWTRPL